MKILVAYDGSDGAKRALALAADIARPVDRVSVICVAEGIPLLGFASSLPSHNEEEELESTLAEAAAALSAEGVEPVLVGRHGDPATLILEEAAEANVDLMIMGTRGKSTVERWLVGSVGTKVLHHAHCSVLVAR